MAKKQRLYMPEFRQLMVDLVRAGRKYADLEKEFGCIGWSIRHGSSRPIGMQAGETVA